MNPTLYHWTHHRCVAEHPIYLSIGMYRITANVPVVGLEPTSSKSRDV